MSLWRRLQRVDQAAGPHLGRRIEAAYERALRALSDSEREHAVGLINLPERDPYRQELALRSNALADQHAPGAAAWGEAFAQNAQRWPREGFDAPRHAWASVPYQEPPPAPAEAPRALLSAARALPVGVERDAHLIAYLGLATQAELRRPLALDT